MKKQLKSLLYLAMAMIVAVGVSSCSDKDDDGPDGGGNSKRKFSGWVEIDGKKHNVNYAYGEWNDDNTELEFSAWSKDMTKYKAGQKVDNATLDIKFNSDGTWSANRFPIPFVIEIALDVVPSEVEDGDSDAMLYISQSRPTYDELTITRDGNKIYVDAKNFEVKYGTISQGVSQFNPSTKINFHFEGSPIIGEW